MINYFTPSCKKSNREQLIQSTKFDVTVKNSRGFCCSTGVKGPLVKAERMAKQLLGEYPQCIAEIRDSSQDSDRTYGPWGWC